MGGVAKAVGSVVGGAVKAVGKAVDNVGDFVVDDVLKPVVKTVDRTVEAALDDPVNTAIRVGAAASGQWWALPLAETTITVAQGGSLQDAVERGAIAYAGSAVAQNVSAGLSPEFTSEFGATAGKSMANIAGNVAGTAVTGGDPLQALVSGGLNAGVAATASQVPGFDEMTKSQQMAVTRAISAELQGKDASQALINTAIGAGIDAAKKTQWDWGTDTDPQAQSTSLVNQTTTNQTAPTQQELVNAPVNPTEQDMNDFYKSIGIDPDGLTPDKATTEDPLSFLNAPGYYDEITGQFVYSDNGGLQGPLDDKSGTNVESMAGYKYDPITKKWVDPAGQEYDLSYLQSSGKPLDTGSLDYLNKTGKSLGEMTTSLLNATPVKAIFDPNSITDLSALGAIGAIGAAAADDNAIQVDPWDLDNFLANWNAQDVIGPVDGVTYGQELLNPTFQKAAEGGIMSLQKYAQGGGVQGISSLGGYAAGGNPRLLRGPGDGMSDNIPATIAGKQPARLADGEFVVPADVVSHLGNGSTEAGANVLYQMMERVRKARTGNPKQGKQINPNKFIPRKGK